MARHLPESPVSFALAAKAHEAVAFGAAGDRICDDLQPSWSEVDVYRTAAWPLSQSQQLRAQFRTATTVRMMSTDTCICTASAVTSPDQCEQLCAEQVLLSSCFR